jgi:hypothetical protein
VESAVRFVGLAQPSRTFVDPQGDAETDGWFHPWGPWPEGDGWTLMLSRRMQGGSWDADLVMVIDDATGTVTDALLVTGESVGTAVTIGLSCDGTTPAVLVDQDQVAVRAWKVATDSLSLVEVDVTELTDAETESACLNTLNPRPPDPD